MTDPLHAKIAEFIDDFALGTWAESGDEAAQHILTLVAEYQPTAVDVFGYNGEFLYAGHLQPRQGGGWNVFHHADTRHQCPTARAEREAKQ
ncbi:hypothetical protein [Amycolatopsis speibonae]|uniref:SnoaL-like domain-containing protein n=1 Tax=Amycolatopsis speibonae TaxID=1450224 RepID=A0ABV7P7X2_9PSEU